MTVFRKPGLFLGPAFRCNAGHTPTRRTKPAGPGAGRGGGARLSGAVRGPGQQRARAPRAPRAAWLSEGAKAASTFKQNIQVQRAKQGRGELSVCISTVTQFSPQSTERT